jgi:hypothetical protein
VAGTLLSPTEQPVPTDDPALITVAKMVRGDPTTYTGRQRGTVNTEDRS